jgi:6,7-dimethyl-8-ribityllumazine synthase
MRSRNATPVADEDKVALVIATFYEDLAAKLEQGARERLSAEGFTDVDKFEVPGAFELPLIARYVADTGRYAAIIALGAVIKGETDHYDYVCGEAARGLSQVQLLSGIPIGFGVLTVNNMDQALARVKGGTKRDSGAHAVEAAVAALAIKRSLSERPRRAGFAG